MIIFIIVGIIFSGWLLICNERAHAQQIEIIDVLGKHPDGRIREDFRDRYDLFGRVSYNSHFWRLVTFRDPYILYPESIVRDVVGIRA